MADIQPPNLGKPTERDFRISREKFEEFLLKIGYKEREDERWERPRKGSSKAETLGITNEQEVLDIGKLFQDKKKLRAFIKYHWSELPPPSPPA